MSTETDEQQTEPEAPVEETVETVAPEQAPEVEGGEPETFPREYVEKLRKEAGDARVKAKDRDDLAARLHTAMVAATGRLADPSDLPFSEDHLGDEDALSAALDDLLARKPHLASRRPRGDVGQGMTGSGTSNDLAGMLRSRA